MNILITSAGRRSYLVRYFKEAVGENGKVFVSNSIFTPTLLAGDGYTLTPSIYDDGYISFLLEYCRKNEITALISLFDIDLPVLAANRSRFEEAGIRLLVSEESFVRVCNDKYQTSLFFARNGIPAPRTFVSVSEVLDNLSSGSLRFPLILKPRFGMGSIGIYRAENRAELECFHEKCSREIAATYLRYETAAAPDQPVIFQEFIDGEEYGLDVINDLNGRYVNTICKKKFAMRAGETDAAETVDFPELTEYGHQLALASRHIANLDCDVIVRDGAIYFIEMNARFGGGYPFSHMAGVNLPKAIIAWLNGEDGNDCCLHEKTGVRTYKEISLVSLEK